MKRYIIPILMLILAGMLTVDFLYYGWYFPPGPKLKDIDAVTQATPSAASYDRQRRVPED